MLITRTSMISGVSRTIDLPITDAQLASYQAGGLAQAAFPNLTDDQREFFITGITADEWDAEFGDDEEDDFDVDDDQSAAVF